MSTLTTETLAHREITNHISLETYPVKAKPITLDWPMEEFRALLHESCETVIRLYENLETKETCHSLNADMIKQLIFEPLPQAGTDVSKVLREVEDKIFSTATLNIGPRYFAYVISCGNQAGILACLLEAALNQNVTKWHMGPSATELEKLVIHWIADFIDYPNADGVLVSGGSAANLTCMSTALKAQAPFDVMKSGLFEAPRLVAYISTEGHSCFDKAFSLMGLGREQLRKIPVTSEFTIDISSLENAIRDDKQAGLYPFCIVGNGGTVNTGAIDPLDRLSALARKYGLWFHVDCAYGGPAAATPLAGPLFEGLAHADSVALDPHKWLYVPFEAGCALVRRKGALFDAFSYQADYLNTTNEDGKRLDFKDYSPQLSRNFKALKIWMTFKAYGAETLRYAIEQNILVMRELAQMIDSLGDFERLAPVPLSIVCFRYLTEDWEIRGNDQYLSRLNDTILHALEKNGHFFVSKTVIANKTALRACCVNHRTTRQDTEGLLGMIRLIGKRIRKQANQTPP